MTNQIEPEDMSSSNYSQVLNKTKSSPEAYPVTREFEDWIDEHFKLVLGMPDPVMRNYWSMLLDWTSSYIGEYEHGTGNSEDIEGSPNLETLRAVMKDFLLTVWYQD